MYKTPTRQTAYKSTEPAVLDALAQYETQMAAWRERIKSLPAEVGLPGRQVLLTCYGPHRAISGFEHDPKTPAPDGWCVRRDTETGLHLLTPHRGRLAGKEADQRMRNAAPPKDCRATLPGMPVDVDDGRALVMATDLRVVDGAAWILWRCPVPDADLNMWEWVPLSAYWAMRETEPDAPVPPSAT